MTSYRQRVDLTIELAVQEWRRSVKDLSGSPDILRYYHDGLGWSWQRSYTNRRDQWCGAFVSYCWGRGGLLPDVRKYHLASTDRLMFWASGAERLIRPGDVEAGDILLLGAGTDPTHIGLAVHRDLRGTVDSIEGNSYGMLGDGTNGEGVVRHSRRLTGSGYRVLWAVRPSGADLESDK